MVYLTGKKISQDTANMQRGGHMPKPEDIVKALKAAGIEVQINPDVTESLVFAVKFEDRGRVDKILTEMTIKEGGTCIKQEM